MRTSRLPAAEITGDAARVASLRRYGVLDAGPSPYLDGLVQVASVLAGTSHAVINLLDETRQYQAAACGFSPGVGPREDSMCQHVVAEQHTIYTTDARTDPRFDDNPHVTGDLDTIRLYAGVPLRDPDGSVLGTLCVFDNEPGRIGRDQLEALGNLADQVVALFELHRRTHALSDVLARVDLLAQTDSLTGLPNRRALEARLAETPGSIVVLFADLDGFKAVNDTLGHEAGDEVLQEVARRLQMAVRRGDLVARQGGDEFVVVSERLDRDGALAMAARLRADLAVPYTTHAGSAVLGASIGVTELRPGESAVQLVGRADAAMYTDKTERRSLGH